MQQLVYGPFKTLYIKHDKKKKNMIRFVQQLVTFRNILFKDSYNKIMSSAVTQSLNKTKSQ